MTSGRSSYMFALLVAVWSVTIVRIQNNAHRKSNWKKSI